MFAMTTNHDTAAPRACIIESPYAGANPVAFRRNIEYLDAAINDVLSRGEVPYASHGFFPGALDDTIPGQRKKGIEAGFAMAELLLPTGAYRAIYDDRGISVGMTLGIAHADRIGMLYIPRTLGEQWRIENDPVYCEHKQEPKTEALFYGPDATGIIGASSGKTTCPDCGEEFFHALLPRDALNVAQTYLTKRA
jgi:hypothetical protein